MEAETGMWTLPHLIRIQQRKEGTPKISKCGVIFLLLAAFSNCNAGPLTEGLLQLGRPGAAEARESQAPANQEAAELRLGPRNRRSTLDPLGGHRPRPF